MPDELDALRRFRDETPGPSTGAWTRARAAIAAARAEERPARRTPAWLPGQRSPRRRPGQRRALWLATAGTAAAAVAGLLAVLLPGSPASRVTGAQIETTAFVTRVEHALSTSGQRNVVGYASTEYPPGYNVVVLSPGDLRIGPSADPNSPWNVRYGVRWSYQDTVKITAFTAARHRVFDLMSAPVHRTQTVTGVMYHSGTWWRGTIGPARWPAPAPSRCVPGVELGSGGWAVFLRHELSCGEFTKGGQQRIGRIEAVELTGNGGREVFWVNPRTYLPVRAILTTAPGTRLQTDFGWFAPTRARLAELHLTVPPGFRQVRAP